MKYSATQPHRSPDLPQRAPSALAAELGAWLWTRSSMLGPVWGVVRAVSAWPGMVIAPDRSGLCLKLGDVVLGQLRWNGRLDLPFGREMGDRLVSEQMAARDPERIDASRVVFDVRTTADVDHALWLLRLAYLSVDSTTNKCLASGDS